MITGRDRGWIGVDVGTHAVKLAQLERVGNAVALREAVVVQRVVPWTGEETLAATPCPSENELLAAVAIGESFQGRTAAATLPMAVYQLKCLQVPEGDSGERREAIARQFQPESASDKREFDYWPIDSLLENATIVRENVSVLSLATAWATRLAQDHQRARLNCNVLDGIPLALGRAVALCPQVDPTRPVAVLDWGFSRATFGIVLDGRPLFVRCLRDCPFRHVIDAIGNALALTRDEARRVAMDYAAGSFGRETASHSRIADGDHDLAQLVEDVVAKTIHQLVSELKRTLTYLQIHRSKLVPGQMWLFGGGATVNGITSLLQNQIQLETRTWTLGTSDRADSVYHSRSAGPSPLAMLGPAIALSALAWEAVSCT